MKKNILNLITGIIFFSASPALTMWSEDSDALQNYHQQTAKEERNITRHKRDSSKTEKPLTTYTERQRRKSITAPEDLSNTDQGDSPGREETLLLAAENAPTRSKRSLSKTEKLSTKSRERQRKETQTKKEESSDTVKTVSPAREENSPLEKKKELPNSREATMSDLQKVTIWIPVISLNQNNKDSIIYGHYFRYKKEMLQYFEDNKLSLSSSIFVDPNQMTVYNQLFRIGESPDPYKYNKSAMPLKDYVERRKKYEDLIDYKIDNRINNKYIVTDVFTAIPQLMGFWDADKFFMTHTHQYVHEIPLQKDGDFFTPLFSIKNEIPKQDSSLGLNAESRQNSTIILRKNHSKETEADVPNSRSSSGDSLPSSRVIHGSL